MSNWNVIKGHFEYELFITTKVAKEKGVKRHILSAYTKEGKLIRVEKGIYTLPKIPIDKYQLLQIKNSKAIYSYTTALYFHGLTKKIPMIVSISVPQGYNASHIIEDGDVKVHYVSKSQYELGKIEIDSPYGGKIITYDKERCICDLIKSKKDIDKEVFTTAIKTYFDEGDRHLNRLIDYSKALGVEERVKTYIDLLG